MDSPQVRERLDAISRWAGTTGHALLRPAVSIYRHGPRHPQLVGSGVLIGIQQETVLVTAAHVLDDVKVHPLTFGAAGTILPIAGWRSATQIPPGGTRDDDPIDLAFVRLTSEVTQHLDPEDMVRATLLEPRVPSHRYSGEYFVTAFPASRQPRRITNGEYEVRPLTFVTEEATHEEYALTRKSRATTLLVHYDKGDVFRNGAQVIGVDLPGVSGGPVWRLPSSFDEEPTIAGIVTVWRKREPMCIVATRAGVLREFLEARFGSLRNAKITG